MASLVTDLGLQWLLDKMANGGSELSADGHLHLYKVDHTPASTDDTQSYTEADFQGYAAVQITFSVAVTVNNGIASIQADIVEFSKGVGGTGNLIYGWYLTTADDATLLAAGDDPMKPIDMQTDNNNYSVQLDFSLQRA